MHSIVCQIYIHTKEVGVADVSQFVEGLTSMLGNPTIHNSDMLVHTHNLSAQEMEAGGPEFKVIEL